jgi:hypothetical protein
VTFSGSVPTLAANAGFTRCAINFDFGNSFYTTQSNWLDCTRTDNTKLLHYGGAFQPVGGPVPSGGCPDIHQATDPVTSDTVLLMQWRASYGANHYLLTDTTINPSHNLDYPNFYVETVARIGQTVAVFGAPFTMAAVWSGADDASRIPSGSEIELDYIEEANCGPGCANGANGLSDGAFHNWGGAAPVTFYGQQHRAVCQAMMLDSITNMGCSSRAMGPPQVMCAPLLMTSSRAAKTPVPQPHNIYFATI